MMPTDLVGHPARRRRLGAQSAASLGSGVSRSAARTPASRLIFYRPPPIRNQNRQFTDLLKSPPNLGGVIFFLYNYCIF